MKSSIDLYTEHIWLFLHSYEEFDYEGITFLPPDTILKFSSRKDEAYGRISHSRSIESHDYCLMDVVWDYRKYIEKAGGAIEPCCIDSGDIIQVYGNLSLKWKEISDVLKEGERKMKKIVLSFVESIDYGDIFHHNLAIESFNSSVEDYLLPIREMLYLKLILSHRNDPPRPYP